jgi:hypothetical protein
MGKLRNFLILILCFVSLNGWAATYYIDYNAADDSANGTTTSTPWKRCPGMTGFAGSYDHSAGDKFVFKGGVTWPVAVLPLTIGYSGASGSSDQYVGGQLESTPYGTGYPVFDGECTGTCTTGTKDAIKAINKSYIVISGIKLIDQGYDQKGIYFDGKCDDIEIKNSWIESQAVNAIQYTPRAYNTTKFYVHHNHFRNNGHALFAGAGVNGYTVDDIRFYNNICESLLGTIETGTNHPDGLQIQGPSDFVFTNAKIYNNQFRGIYNDDMTAIINIQWNDGTEIYNNLFAFENTTDIGTSTALAVIAVGYMNSQHNKNIKIYNNTISSDANYAPDRGWKYCIQIAGNQGTVDIKNNIFSNCQYGMLLVDGWTTGTTLTSDYNFYNQRQAMIYDHNGTSNIYKTTASICSALEIECNSKSGDPKFVDIASDGTYGSMDFSLQSDSTAKEGGWDLGAPYNVDILGLTRSDWDIGAYEYNGAADTTPPHIDSATIDSTGTKLTLAFSESVTINDSAGFTLGMSGGAAGLSLAETTATTLKFNITGRAIEGPPSAETGTLDYVTVADGIQDAAGNDLASTGETDIAVTNNSEHTPAATTYAITVENSGNATLSPLANQVVVSGADSTTFTCAPLNSGWKCDWSGSCGATGNGTTYKKTAIDGDCEVRLTAIEKRIFR